MVKIITGIFLCMLLMVFLLFGGTPVSKTLSNASYTIGAGTKDTITLTNFQMSGDSAGIMAEINQDSCSATFSYQYSSPNNYTDTTQFANLPVILTMPVNSKGGFSEALPWKAGVYKAYLYVVLMNNKASSQTINLKVYSINWR